MVAFEKRNEDRIWYTDQADQFVEEIESILVADDEMTGIEAQTIKQGFLNCLAVSGEVAYLPTRRQLETQVGLGSQSNVGFDGTGIVKFLFRCKNSSSTDPLRALFDEIVDAFRVTSNGCDLDVYFSSGDQMIDLHFRDPGRTYIPTANCGLGLHDLLVILTICLTPSNRIILLEEPETHLHPDLQRRLAQFLKELPGKQYFVTTHSNVFLNDSIADRIFFVTYDDEVKVSDATSRSRILSQLGYSISDNLLADLVILSEGPHDWPVLEELLKKMKVLPTYSVKYWPLNGNQMDQLDLSVLAESYKLLAVIDNDPGSAAIRERFVQKCADLGIPVRRLNRYAIENYIPWRAYEEEFGSNMPPGLSSIALDKKVADQLLFNPKSSLRSLARRTELSDIQGTDLMTFLELVASELKSKTKNDS